MNAKLFVAFTVVGLVLGAAGCGSSSDGSGSRLNPPPPSNPPQQPEPPAPTLYVVGDSLSDIGNLAALSDYLLGRPIYPQASVGLCHPGALFALERDCTDVLYERSRVSNGPVAVEHLAAHLGIVPFAPSFHVLPERPVVGVNYAVASAKARASSPKDLGHQVERLLLDHGPALPAGAAIVLMIGGNDAIDALQAAALPNLEGPDGALPDIGSPGETDPPGSEPRTIVAQAVAGITAAASRLLDAGGCVLVANVPNLARLPAVRDTAELEGIDLSTAFEVAESVTAEFNASLAQGLAALPAAHAGEGTLVPFDLAAAVDTAADAAALAGTNVTDACFDSERYTASTLGERHFHPDCEPLPEQPPRFDAFFFWDGIHPTGAAHAAIGAALVDTYEAGCRAEQPAG